MRFLNKLLPISPLSDEPVKTTTQEERDEWSRLQAQGWEYDPFVQLFVHPDNFLLPNGWHRVQKEGKWYSHPGVELGRELIWHRAVQEEGRRRHERGECVTCCNHEDHWPKGRMTYGT